MKQELIENLVKTFFTCNRDELIRIFTELLNTMVSEETLSALEIMSRNYETAQFNPEIHTLPGNLKDARDAIFPYFWGTDGWFSKLHLENVKGPANYASLVGALACLLKNPNLCVDTYSQRSNELEVKAVTTLANLFFYHIENPWGVFTMGGTISNLYGGKIGVEKVLPQAMKKGVRTKALAGIVSRAAHYSNETLAGWLGLGTDNLHAVPTDPARAPRQVDRALRKPGAGGVCHRHLRQYGRLRPRRCGRNSGGNRGSHEKIRRNAAATACGRRRRLAAMLSQRI
jgi:hypothetical protein